MDGAPEDPRKSPDGTAAVSLGAWSFPITETAGYDKPEYRAQLMAGALYLAWKRGNLDESHFMTVDGDRWSDVYYEDIRVLRVYPQDNQWEHWGTGPENRWPAPRMGSDCSAAAGTQSGAGGSGSTRLRTERNQP